MKIANGIEMLEISMKLIGQESTICPTLLWDEDTAILVDAGIIGSLSEIKKVMGDAGVPFEKLNKIIVTHQDVDHIGGIKAIIEELPEVKVFAHKEDKPYIMGEKKLIKMNSAFMERINDLPEEQKKKVLYAFENSHVRVDETLADGEELSDCGGIVVIHTPHHTPGHICLYHKPSKTLILGDEIRVRNGEFIGSENQPLNEKNMKKAVNSIKKFEKYDIENIIAYHGGLFNEKSN
ncbi:MBL fold metallo-hydrolase [Methanobrevibacter sp. TMH8]|uniref:MBL fold metallo-hydrolase n=1 Tax=Methanobrevibacter sp. TMH8 TaxID=2848611 RepID=UPI001CCD31E3|nr:MBL fold metallo-hydrolase [Methanobrevibacter sp. TMH8]MBZ9571102.1 MBL fold metallo-hydrolase [Methanobrevibacter sp. TMH8]